MTLIYIGMVVLKGVAPIAIGLLFIWFVVRVIGFFTLTFSADGGFLLREQMHRHRLQNIALFLVISACVTGGLWCAYGDASGPMTVSLPGHIKIEHAGAWVVFFGFASSVLYILLGLKSPDPPKQPDVQIKTVYVGPGQPVPSSIVVWFKEMSYIKASVITLLLLPFLNVLALPVGAVLFWLASTQGRLR